MDEYKFFRTKQGTKFDDKVQQYFELRPRWGNVVKRLSVYLGEKVTRIVMSPNYLSIEPSEITKPENKALFTKDGNVRKRGKKPTALREFYHNLIDELGLKHFRELRWIEWCNGITGLKHQTVERFLAIEDGIHVIYYKTNFDLDKEYLEQFEMIDEIQFEQAHLDQLKRNKESAS
jgi:hypothetical protein